MQAIWTIAFGTAAGLTFAGVLTSGYDLLTDQRLRFALPGEGGAHAMLLGLLLRFAAGPFLLVRSAYDRLLRGETNPLVLAGMVGLACMWGCLMGIVVLDVFGGFAPSAAAAH